MTRTLVFITHPDVIVDRAIPIPDWPLSPKGRARMQAATTLAILAGATALWSSPERKAQDGAAILAQSLDLPIQTHPGLAENDRSATGYLPPPEFQATADQFFAHPTRSIRGWERAIDAQSRIVQAVAELTPTAEKLVIVSHGAVGALLLAHLLQTPITRAHDQPGTTGGNHFIFTPTHLTQPWHAPWHPPWHPIDPDPQAPPCYAPPKAER